MPTTIKTGRYKRPDLTGWLGWIEPEDKSWIVFVDLDHSAMVFLDRDPVTGACK